MSSASKAATPAARRNPTRAAKARRATTDAPRRARSLPHGNSAGGAQADHHEAAETSDHGTSDGDSSGAEQAHFARAKATSRGELEGYGGPSITERHIIHFVSRRVVLSPICGGLHNERLY